MQLFQVNWVWQKTKGTHLFFLNPQRERLARVSQQLPLALAKKAIYAWDSIHFDKGLARAEKIYLDELMKTEDAQEGIRAFLEKRHPTWKGR